MHFQVFRLFQPLKCKTCRMSLLGTIVLLISAIVHCTEGQRRITLYDRVRQQGAAVTFEGNIPDLSRGRVNFDNRARSACVTGIWLLYENVNYNRPRSGGRVEIIHGVGTQRCQDLTLVSQRASSLRTAGNADNSNRIDFFETADFGGNQVFGTVSVPNLNFVPRSGVISGSSRWTLFDQINYQGNRVCLSPASVNPPIPGLFSTNNMTSIVRSMRIGCT